MNEFHVFDSDQVIFLKKKQKTPTDPRGEKARVELPLLSVTSSGAGAQSVEVASLHSAPESLRGAETEEGKQANITHTPRP